MIDENFLCWLMVNEMFMTDSQHDDVMTIYDVTNIACFLLNTIFWWLMIMYGVDSWSDSLYDSFLKVWLKTNHDMIHLIIT